jgi:uncharacterized membrane protein
VTSESGPTVPTPTEATPTEPVRTEPTLADATAALRREAGEAERGTSFEVEVLGAERLVFFSDAVVAIAITLLALDLPVPIGRDNPAILQAMRTSSDVYLAFLISFVVIAGNWFNHHLVFKYVTAVPARLRSLNLFWLLMIVLTPFVTRTLTADNGFEVRFILYASVQALAALTFIAMVRVIDRSGVLRPGAPPHLIWQAYWSNGVVSAMFLISMPIALLTHSHWAYLCWIVVPVAARLFRRFRLLRQLRRAQ